jgi:hypothetical protein
MKLTNIEPKLIPFKYFIKFWNDFKEWLLNLKTNKIMKKEPKQETIEEIIDKLSIKDAKSLNLFLEGMQYKKERSYSEEEVENILIEYVKTNPTKPYRVVSWFKQF